MLITCVFGSTRRDFKVGFRVANPRFENHRKLPQILKGRHREEELKRHLSFQGYRESERGRTAARHLMEA